MCAEEIVVACEAGPGSILMTVASTASDSETIELARQLHDDADAASLNAGATLQRESTGAPALDSDIETPPLWQVTVYPGDAGQAETTLRGILEVAAIPGTLAISQIGDWAYVTVADIAVFDEVFQEVSSTPLFETGGTYTLLSLDQRLRVVHVPDRTTDDAIHEVIDIARDYPAAEVLLEAPTSGPQYPKLYIARLTPEEVLHIDARLRAPHLANADVDGYAVEFVLGSTGTDGTTYTSGTLGNVPAN